MLLRYTRWHTCVDYWMRYRTGQIAMRFRLHCDSCSHVIPTVVRGVSESDRFLGCTVGAVGRAISARGLRLRARHTRDVCECDLRVQGTTEGDRGGCVHDFCSPRQMASCSFLHQPRTTRINFRNVPSGGGLHSVRGWVMSELIPSVPFWNTCG